MGDFDKAIQAGDVVPACPHGIYGPRCPECPGEITAHQEDKSAVAVERRKDGTVKSGSPNPGGQPKWVKEVREGLRGLHPAALERLKSIIADGEDKDANAAIRLVYDFSLPKPKQTHRVEGKGGDPLAMLTPEALVAFITKGKP